MTKASVVLMILFAVSSCAAARMQPEIAVNPPPLRALNEASGYQLEDLQIPAGLEAREPEVCRLLQQKLDVHVLPIVTAWNHSAQGTGEPLILTPRLETLDFISRGERFFGGAIGDASEVRLRLEIRGRKTGEMVADPVFYQFANPYRSTWTLGSTDQGIIARVVALAAKYLEDNYSSAQGGPTGARIKDAAEAE